jgi:predicted Zn finger-like uncharacterized protein
MRFCCPNCQTPYNVPDEKIFDAGAANGVRTRCHVCGTGLILDLKTDSVREASLSAGSKPSRPPSHPPAGEYRRDTPTVLSMSNGVKKESDIVAVLCLILVVSLGFAAGYYTLSHINVGPFKAGVQFIMNLKDDLSFPPVFREFFGKKRAAPRRNEAVSARQRVRKGYEFYSKERLDPALDAFDRAIQEDPKIPEAHYWRGRTLLKMGRDDAAVEAFTNALALRPDYWEALDNLGWLSMRRGKYSQSLSFLNRSIECKPDNAWAYYNRGFLHAKMGNTALAVKDAQEACRLGYQKGCQMAQRYAESKEKTDAPVQN